MLMVFPDQNMPQRALRSYAVEHLGCSLTALSTALKLASPEYRRATGSASLKSIELADLLLLKQPEHGVPSFSPHSDKERSPVFVSQTVHLSYRAQH